MTLTLYAAGAPTAPTKKRFDKHKHVDDVNVYIRCIHNTARAALESLETSRTGGRRCYDGVAVVAAAGMDHTARAVKPCRAVPVRERVTPSPFAWCYKGAPGRSADVIQPLTRRRPPANQ